MTDLQNLCQTHQCLIMSQASPCQIQVHLHKQEKQLVKTAFRIAHSIHTASTALPWSMPVSPPSQGYGPKPHHLMTCATKPDPEDIHVSCCLRPHASPPNISVSLLSKVAQPHNLSGLTPRSLTSDSCCCCCKAAFRKRCTAQSRCRDLSACDC